MARGAALLAVLAATFASGGCSSSPPAAHIISPELKLDRSSGTPGHALPTVTVKTITAWASYDGGTTWHAVTVTHSGSSWTAAVPNNTAGTVSLRDTVTDTKGNSSTVTIYSAYAVS